MRKKLWISVIIFLFFVSGCDIVQNNNQQKVNMNDLNVASDFNYNTTRNVRIQVTISNEWGELLNGFPVSVFQDTFRIEEKIITKGLTESEGIFLQDVSLPTDAEQVTLQCLMGYKTIGISNGQVLCEFSGTRKQTPQPLYPFKLKRSGLIGKWQFNTGSGNVAYDEVGNNDGSIQGAVWVSGRVEDALEFDGHDDYVQVPEAPIFDIQDSLTLMAWVKPKEYKTARIAEKGDWDGYGIYLDIWRGWQAAVTFDDYRESLDWGDGRPGLYQWYHIVMTYNNSQLKLFINGELKNSENVSGTLINNSRDLCFGSNGGSQKFFKGIIDEIYLYDRALSNSEIEDYYNATKPIPQMISIWHFDENSGNIAYDSKGNNDGTISGAEWTSGISGSGLDFNGEGGRVLIPNSEDLNIVGENLSFSYWFKMQEIGDSGAMIFKNTQYLSRINSEGRVNFAIYKPNLSEAYMDWSDRITDTDWHHVATTYDGSQMKIFVDGQCLKTKQTSGDIQSTTHDILIGSQASTNYFDGIIDEVAIYNKTLTTVEINNIYNNTGNPDTDEDGVADDADDYPNDPTKAFDTYYPAENINGTIAFEDMWPSKGDYDFNDLIMDYNINQILNADNDLVEIVSEFSLRAIGAGYHNGFYIQFPFSQDKIDSLNIGENESIQWDTNTEKAVLRLFPDASDLLLPPPDASGSWVNTVPGETYVAPVSLSFNIVLTEPLSTADLTYLPPYNPFLTVNGYRGREVHFAGYPPTSKVDTTFFRTGDDDSDPDENRYYKSANNLPWAVQIPIEWSYPIEEAELTWAYLVFQDWAESSGNQYPDWYESISGRIDEEYIYSE